MRVLLVDPQANVRFALRALLERQPGVEIAGEASSVGTLLRQIRTRCPDLVLLDGSLHDGAAADLVSALRGACPGLAIVVLSARPETRQLALNAGADGFVCKTDSPEVLLAAVRSFQQAVPGELPPGARDRCDGGESRCRDAASRADGSGREEALTWTSST